MMWEGTTQPRSNLNRFTVAETVNAIHPQVLNGLFYETPAFILREQPNLTENTSRAITALLAMQLTEMNIREEVDWALFSALTFGTLIMKWGFKSYTKKKVKYVRQESPVVVNSALPGQPPQHIS